MYNSRKIYLVLLWSICSIFFICIYYSIGIGMLDGIENFVFRCSDFGKYYTQVLNYLYENISLKDTIEFANEPGWYINVSNIVRLSGLEAASSIILFLAVTFWATALTVVIFIKRATKNSTIAYIGGSFLILSFIQNYAFFIHGRQTLANLGLLGLIFIISFFEIKKIRMILLSSIFLGLIMITHRSIMGISIIGLGIFFIYGCLFERDKVSPVIFILLGGFVLSLPMFLFSLEDYRRTLLYLINGNILSRSQGGVYNSGGGANTQFGISVITGAYTNSIPLGDYIKYFPVALILSLSYIFKLWKEKKIRPLIIFLIFLAYYTSGPKFFVNRMPTTLDPLAIIAFCIVLSRVKFHSKYFYISISLLLVVLHKPLGIFKANGFLIHKDEISISALKESIPKVNSIIFGSQCILDLFQQLGYTTALNYPLYPIANLQQLEASGIFMTPTELWNFSEVYWNFLGKDKNIILPKFLKDKDVYLIMSWKWNKKEVKRLEEIKENKNFTILKISPDIRNKNYLLDYALHLTGERVYFENLTYYFNLLKREKVFN